MNDSRLKINISRYYPVFLIFLCSIIFIFIRLYYLKFLPGASPVELAAGVGDKPFQYRVLVPIIVRVLNINYDISYTTIEVLSIFILFALSMKWIYIYNKNPLWILVLLIPLLYNYEFIDYNWYEPYDIPAIDFMSAGLMLIYYRKKYLFYCLIPFAILNRETSIMLIILYAIHYKGSIRNLKTEMSVLLGLFVCIKFLLIYIYYDNTALPFSETCNRLLFNLYYIMSGQIITVFGGIWILAIFSKRDNFIQKSCYIIIPFILIMMILGNIYEYRIFNEIIPLLFLLSINTTLPSIITKERSNA